MHAPPCIVCGKPTVYICGGCAYDTNERVPLCDDKECIKKHREDKHLEEARNAGS